MLVNIEPNKKIAFNYYLRFARAGNAGSKSNVIRPYYNESELKPLVTQYHKGLTSANKEAIERQPVQLEKRRRTH